VIIGPNGLIAVTGAATLPVGAAVMTLAALPPFVRPKAISRVLALEGLLGLAIVAFSVVGALVPSVVPGVPAPLSVAALALFAVGLVLYGALAVVTPRLPARLTEGRPLSLLRDESDITFDSRCIEALEGTVTVEQSNLVSIPSRS
jgi:hypothetical protein